MALRAYLNGVESPVATRRRRPAWDTAPWRPMPPPSSRTCRFRERRRCRHRFERARPARPERRGRRRRRVVQPELVATFNNGVFSTVLHPATPAAANKRRLWGLVADTKFSVDRGFMTRRSLWDASATPGAEIRWTTNAARPVRPTARSTPRRCSSRTRRSSGRGVLPATSPRRGHAHLPLPQPGAAPVRHAPAIQRPGRPAPGRLCMDPNVVNSSKYGPR